MKKCNKIVHCICAERGGSLAKRLCGTSTIQELCHSQASNRTSVSSFTSSAVYMQYVFCFYCCAAFGHLISNPEGLVSSPAQCDLPPPLRGARRLHLRSNTESAPRRHRHQRSSGCPPCVKVSFQHSMASSASKTDLSRFPPRDLVQTVRLGDLGQPEPIQCLALGVRSDIV